MTMIRRITEQDADLLREVRLCALSDSPMAFGSTYAGESAFDAQEWRDRAKHRSCSENDATFFAFDGNKCCGIIGCFRKTDAPTMATVVSMWVAPQARRKGVGQCLIETVEQWSGQRGFSHLLLDVVSNNTAAIAFYQKCGFCFTGATGPYPNDPKLRELFMVKKI
jgi:ribosomal protein S18 acetylase RimI-like enzyme